MTTNQRPRVEQIAIKVNGTDLDKTLMNTLFLAEVEMTLFLPSMFVLRFHDDDLQWVDGSKFPLGASVDIGMTDANNPNQTKTIMIGEITAVEPEFEEDTTATLTIRGYDKSHRLNRETKNKAWMNVTDSDIARQLISASGLSPQVESTTERYKHVFQHNQTDLEFLHMLAERNGFEVHVDSQKLYFRKAQTTTAAIVLKWGESLRSFRPRLSLAKQVNDVLVRGWDPARKQAIVGRATTSSASPQIGLGKWGGQAAQAAISAAKRLEVRRPVQSQAEADTLAKAILDEINAGFIEAEGVAFGNPDLIAGKVVSIQKVGTQFSGKYVVTSARHIYSTEEGYDTYFTVEGRRPQLMADLVAPSTPNAMDLPWGGVVPALVTNNDSSQDSQNSDKKGYVKVKFPWLDESQESFWARVAGVGAGDQRGFFWLPEVNDEVLVAFEHGDFNRPYVIGSLWNGQDAPPEATPVQSGSVQIRTLKTRDGHTIRLTDGTDKAIEIIDAENKTSVKMDTKNKTITIKSEGDIVLEAQGKIELKAQGQIDVKATQDLSLKGNNLQAEAQAQLNLKGSASSKLESTGQTVVKGSIVNIN